MRTENENNRREDLDQIYEKLGLLEKQLLNQSEGLRKQLIHMMGEVFSNNALIQQVISENYSITSHVQAVQESVKTAVDCLILRLQEENSEISKKLNQGIDSLIQKNNLLQMTIENAREKCIAQIEASKAGINDTICNSTRELAVDLNNVAKELTGDLSKVAVKITEVESSALAATRERFDKIEPHFTYMRENLPVQTYYYNDFERKDIESFYEYRQRADYKEKFLRLLNKLDPESRATVTRILKRQELVEGTTGQRVYLYTPEEQRIIAAGKKKMAEVLEISEDCYCMDGYLLPIKSFEMSVFFDKHGLGKVKDVEKKIRRKNILDVGGYIGDSVLIFSPLTEEKVYSFEAISSNFELMKKTIQLNGITNAIPIKGALSDKDEEIEFFLSKSCSGANKPSSAHPVTGIEKVQCYTLDSFIEKNALEVGLIKVDIEGAEQAFLRGAKDTICKQKPILLISIYHNPDDFFDIKPMIESWDVGYRFQIHKPDDITVSREILLIAET